MMSFQNWLGDMLDSVFAPACASDSCSSGFVAGLGASGIGGGGADFSHNGFATVSSDDWTNAWGTQAPFQPAAECGSISTGSTFDSYSSFDSGSGNSFGCDW